MPRIGGSIDLNVLIAFLFGIIFLTVMLCFAVYFPNPSGLQLKVFMVTLSIAAAGVGAMIPGVINVNYKGFVRAGGAMALFAIVWFSNPAIIANVAQLVRPTQNPQEVTNKFLSELKAGEVQKVYDQFDSNVKEQVSSASWQELYDNVIKPLGDLKGRLMTQSSPIESYPGWPLGVYNASDYIAKYANVPACRHESMVLRATQHDTWSVFSFRTDPPDIPCPPALNQP